VVWNFTEIDFVLSIQQQKINMLTNQLGQPVYGILLEDAKRAKSNNTHVWYKGNPCIVLKATQKELILDTPEGEIERYAEKFYNGLHHLYFPRVFASQKEGLEYELKTTQSDLVEFEQSTWEEAVRKQVKWFIDNKDAEMMYTRNSIDELQTKLTRLQTELIKGEKELKEMQDNFELTVGTMLQENTELLLRAQHKVADLTLRLSRLTQEATA